MTEVKSTTSRKGFANRIARAFDAAIYAVAPQWGAQRIATRQIFEHSLSRMDQYRAQGLEAAENDRLREARWMGSRLSADAMLENGQSLTTTRVRSRELCTNDFLGGAVDSRVRHTVSTGFTVQAKIVELRGVVTPGRATELNEEFEAVYKLTEPTADLTRKRSLWQKTCLFARLLDVDGEAFAVFSDADNSEGPLPFAIEIVDADRVETPPHEITNPLCRLGILYDANHRIVGYYVRQVHPFDNKEFSMAYDFVPAVRMCHKFDEWFSGQSRGLPWLTRSLNKAKDGKDLQEAAIIGAQVEACFAGFIKGGSNPLRKAIGAATDTDSKGNRLQNIVPGQLNYLGKDEEITFSTPSKSNSVGTLQSDNDRRVAAGLNWPYELCMGDWRGVSFAGGRIVLHGAKLTTRSRQKMIIEGLLDPWWNRMVDESVMLGVVDIDPRVFARNRHIFRAHNWTSPKWDYSITPGEEVNATVTAIDNNLMTLEEALGERQEDFEEVIAQRTKERKAERDNEIVPNKTAQADAQAEQMRMTADQQAKNGAAA